MAVDPLPLFLKKREARRVRNGHPWVFSNEVDVGRSPLTGFDAGQPVDIFSHDDKLLGVGYANPHSLICARVVSRQPGQYLDRALLVRRLEQSLSLRQRLYPHPFYRLVFSESDGLPGLVVDRYGAVLVAQFGTAGMEQRRDDVIAALQQVLEPSAIVLRNDISARALEGLESYVDTPMGSMPELIGIQENERPFEISPLHGHKTGWYFDHAANRRRFLDYVPGKRVLDVFSYSGAWGVLAAVAGARAVMCVDSSEPALEQVQRNAKLNVVEPLVTTRRGDAFQVLKALRAEGERFDVIVLDPPAFIRRKKDVRTGTEAYQRLNRLAAGLLEPDAILVSASCSYHLSRDNLMEIVARAARAVGGALQILEDRGQGPDHPVHPALPESAYLKTFFTRLYQA